MIDFETGEYLPEHVGGCDRQRGCGYHLSAKQLLARKGMKYITPIHTNLK
jgi:hypothetical protein